VAANLVTSRYFEDMLVTNLKQIWYLYIRSWFCFDIMILIVDWFSILVENDGLSIAASARVLRMTRFLRLLRLLRLARAKRMRDSAFDLTTSAPVIMHMIRSAGLILSLFSCMHLLACAWVWVGMQLLNAETGGWTVQFDSYDPAMLYAVSLHWTICNFQGSMDVQPANLSERIFAIFALSFAVVAFPYFISNVTSRIVQMKSLATERSAAIYQLQELLSRRSIPLPLAASAKIALKQHFAERHRVSGDNVMKLLPDSLQTDLLCEIRVPLFHGVSFLMHLRASCMPLVRRLCSNGFELRSARPTEVIFSGGDMCNAALCLDMGRCHYNFLEEASDRVSQLPERPIGAIDSMPAFGSVASMQHALGTGPISHGSWLCQGALWLKWQNLGTLRSHGYSSLLQCGADIFHAEVSQFPRARNEAVSMAHFWEFCVSTLLDDVASERCTDRGIDHSEL